MGKQLPWKQRAIDKNRIGNAVRGNAGKAAEKQTKDHHHEQWLNDRPGGPEHRLLVADFDIPPGEKVKQFAVFPEFSEAKRNNGSSFRLNEESRQPLLLQVESGIVKLSLQTGTKTKAETGQSCDAVPELSASASLE